MNGTPSSVPLRSSVDSISLGDRTATRLPTQNLSTFTLASQAPEHRATLMVAHKNLDFKRFEYAPRHCSKLGYLNSQAISGMSSKVVFTSSAHELSVQHRASAERGVDR